MADDITYEKDPRLFDYSTTRDLGFHSPRFTGTDYGLTTLYEALNAADWTQTQQAARNPHKRFTEQNFPAGSAELIGEHPNRDKINALMMGQALAVPVAASQLPDFWRKALLMTLIAGKSIAVRNNQSIGLDAYRF